MEIDQQLQYYLEKIIRAWKFRMFKIPPLKCVLGMYEVLLPQNINVTLIA